MAQFHFHVSQIKRSAGSSAVASAAYRAGESLYSKRYEEVNDYTAKEGVILSEILLPDNAPQEYADRQTLWNAVEAAEKRGDAQLAYSFDIALQNEFSQEENLQLARRFIEDNFVKKGMIADFALHDPERKPGGIPNPHIHVMCPIRPLRPDGSWGEKQKKVPVLDETGRPIRDEKHHRCKFNAVPTTDWGRPETLERWRKNWCLLCNRLFEEKKLPERIDHRSYEKQGVDLMAQVHEGPQVRAMEKKGIPTEKGEFNRFVRATNTLLQAIRRKLAELDVWIRETKKECADEPSPDLRELLIRYMDHMKAGASSYSRYGRQKAGIAVLKDVSSAFIFLDEHHISKMDDLEKQLNALSEETDALKDSMKASSERSRLLKEALFQTEIFQKNLSVFLEFQKPGYRFRKAAEAYKEAHESELKLFYRARRILKEAGMQDTLSEELISKWHRELAALDRNYAADYEKLIPLRKKLQQLSHIRYCVERVLKSVPQCGHEIRNGREAR